MPLEIGKFKSVIRGAQLSRNQNTGSLYIDLVVEFLEGPNSGTKVPHPIYLTSGTINDGGAEKTLATLGFDAKKDDWGKIRGKMLGREIVSEVQESTYRGKTTNKIRWIFPADSPTGSESDEDLAKAAAALFAAKPPTPSSGDADDVPFSFLIGAILSSWTLF